MYKEIDIAGDKYSIYGTMRYKGQEIVCVRLKSNTVQAFYCSQDPVLEPNIVGQWVPFDGIAYEGSYMNRWRFTRVGTPLPRYGTEEIKRVSEALNTTIITSVQEESWQDCNAFIRAHGGTVCEK